jgi:asparagine synthase (glutamine-hydrolysing)
LPADAIPVALGFRRLSILDLSEAANQPMVSRSGRFVLAFNGEIYNFKELRRELTEGGAFRSTGDTEVLLRAYEHWGDGCVHRLRGMFAFAVWDRERQRLFAAVDRFGIKPFAYSEKGGRLVFASEIRALLTSGLVSGRLSLDGLRSYLALGTTGWPRTLLEEVHRVPPAHALVWEKGQARVFPYWQLPSGRGADAVTRRGEAVERIRETLLDSARLHIVSDVPFGAFLSGGLDSSAIVGLMRKAGVSRIKTFSIGFRERLRASSGVRDESYEAFCAAKHYQTEHHEWIVQPHFLKEVFPQYLRALDHPSVDGLNTFLVSYMTGKHVRVVLSGLGGDELFGGYQHFLAAWLCGQKSPLTRALVRLGGAFGSSTVQKTLRRLGQGHWPLAHTFRGMPPSTWCRWGRQVFAPAEREQLLMGGQPSAQESLLGMEVETGRQDGSLLHGMLAAEMHGYMANTLLRDSDVMSMSQSLELRVPMLDHKLAELVYGLPADWFFRWGRPKSLLSDAVADVVPTWIRLRRKAYFNLPLGSWVKKALEDELKEAVSAEAVERRGVFRPESARGYRQRFLETGSHPYKAWMLAVFEWWARNVEAQTGVRLEPPV